MHGGLQHDLCMPNRMEGVYFCRVCGGIEGSLLYWCPGYKLTLETTKDIYAGWCRTPGRKVIDLQIELDRRKMERERRKAR